MFSEVSGYTNASLSSVKSRFTIEDTQTGIRIEVVHATEYDALTSEAESLRKDAYRYRWLRLRIASSQLKVLGAENTSDTENGVDAGIDAAMYSPENPS